MYAIVDRQKYSCTPIAPFTSRGVLKRYVIWFEHFIWMNEAVQRGEDPPLATTAFDERATTSKERRQVKVFSRASDRRFLFHATNQSDAARGCPEVPISGLTQLDKGVPLITIQHRLSRTLVTWSE
jgi:hypothetical protein